MKHRIVALIGIVALGLVIVPRIAFSQFNRDCPALIRNAVERAEQICTGTGRNQVCYANSWTQAEPQAFITDFSFQLGDITDLTNIRSLRLGGLDVVNNEWGVVLMRLQANLPDTLPGQNVMFLIFGDVELEQVDGVDARPMQAIRLRTGIGGPGCGEAPPNGLLIQTPHGVGRVLLQVNGVDVSLGSTVFFTAQANREMTISTLEGSALVHANGGWSAALPGTQVSVAMSDNLEPMGTPSLPEPYMFAEMATLPLSTLERNVEVLPALDASNLSLLQQEILDGGLPEIGDFSAIPLDLMQENILEASDLFGEVDGFQLPEQAQEAQTGAGNGNPINGLPDQAANAANPQTSNCPGNSCAGQPHPNGGGDGNAAINAGNSANAGNGNNANLNGNQGNNGNNGNVPNNAGAGNSNGVNPTNSGNSASSNSGAGNAGNVPTNAGVGNNNGGNPTNSGNSASSNSGAGNAGNVPTNAGNDNGNAGNPDNTGNSQNANSSGNAPTDPGNSGTANNPVESTNSGNAGNGNNAENNAAGNGANSGSAGENANAGNGSGNAGGGQQNNPVPPSTPQSPPNSGGGNGNGNGGGNAP